jgi:hypothetical protein
MQQGFERDPLENLAIVEPEIPHESVGDVIKSYFRFGLPVAMQAHYDLCCSIVDQALQECGKRGVEDGFSHSTLEAASELLKLFTEPGHKYDGRLLAHVLLLVINRNTLSEVQIARMCGVTRARVSKLKVELQDRYGLRPRCGRSDEARRKFSQLVRNRGPRNKETKWRARLVFTKTLRNGSNHSGKPSKKTAIKRSRRRALRSNRR